MPGSASVAPALAEACKPNPELTTWTCTLRTGVTFAGGATADANDVVLSFAVQWDTEHPLHRGRRSSSPFIDVRQRAAETRPAPELNAAALSAARWRWR